MSKNWKIEVKLDMVIKVGSSWSRGGVGARANTGSPSSTSLNPSQVTGNVLWLRADSGVYQDLARLTPATSNDDTVKVWDDLSGNGNHHAVSTSDATLKTNFQNGEPAIQINIGTSLALESGSTATLDITEATPRAILLVAKFSDITGGTVDTFWSKRNEPAGLYRGWYYYRFGPNGVFGFQDNSTVGGGVEGYGSTSLGTTTFYSLMAWDAGTGDITSLSARNNGVAETVVATLNNNTASTSSNTGVSKVGEGCCGVSNDAVTQILELALFDGTVLTNTEINGLEAYVSNRYGLAAPTPL